MNSLTSLSTPELCRIVENIDHIFSEALVRERIREAQIQMEQDPSTGGALAAFSKSIAPILLEPRFKQSTISTLQLLGCCTDGSAGMIRDLFFLMLFNDEYTALVSAVNKHGASGVLAALYKYGTPPHMHMVSAYLDAEADQQHWRTYMADMLGLSVRALFGKNGSNIPLYSEIIRRGSAKDSRSGKEILDHVKETLRKRIEKRKEHETA